MRHAVIVCIVALGLSLPVVAHAASSRGLSPLGSKSATFQEQLEKGLRARRPEEFAFIARVVAMVQRRQLPLDLVRSTFDWARDKRPYPYPYFERGLKQRAARLGITVR